MRYFIIKAYKFSKEDPFGFKETSDHLTLCAHGLTDLRRTVRYITPQGYRVPTPRTLGKRLQPGHPLIGMNLLKTKTLEINEVEQKPVVLQWLPFTNRAGFKALLKLTEAI